MTELLRDSDRIYTSMIRDIHGVGRVLDIKFRLLRTAYTAFMISLVTGVLCFLGIYFALPVTEMRSSPILSPPVGPELARGRAPVDPWRWIFGFVVR